MKEKADLILINGNIYTTDENFSTCSAMAIRGGVILDTGSDRQIQEKYSSGNVTDMKGKPVYPGFIDGHSHFYGYARSLRQVDLNGTQSFQEVLDRLSERKTDPPGTWLVGRGWDQNNWEDKDFPDRSELDRMFPGRPVVLIRVCGHVVLANEEALKRGGFFGKTDFQPAEIERHEGKITGILRENASDRMRNFIPGPDPGEDSRLIETAQQNCFAVGLTGVTDAGLETHPVRFLEKMEQEGKLKIRIYVMLASSEENIQTFIDKGPVRSDRLNIRAIKLYADGSLGSRSALLKVPYSDDPGNYGIRVTSPDSIREICRIALLHGYQVNTHAIGDSAVGLILNIYKDFLKGKNDLRWRIEHAQIVTPGDRDLFRDYSVIPSVQATHATSDMSWAEGRLGKERISSAYAYKDLLKENGWLVNGTDFPIEKINPLLTFYAAVARKDLSWHPAGGFQPENALTREEALRSITIWAAKGEFEERNRGSLEPGKVADFVVLDKDIMKILPEEIPGVTVLLTVVGGETVFGK